MEQPLGQPGSSGTGAGGNGLQSSISGTSTYYAGGGGGGSYATTPGIGGLGGGGAGVTGGSIVGTSGTGNTGGGGGGTDYPGGNSGAGGSGVVIIRYPSTYSLPLTTAGYPTVAVGGGYRTYTFTSSGSITF